MTSSPLLTRVAELIVMTGPMAQVGWASASSTLTWARSAFVRPRKGPPDAVTTSLRTSALVPEARAWKRAACSESTGMICPGLARAFTSGPPTMSDSLLASARVRPASRAARVGARPMEPGMRLRRGGPEGPGEAVEDGVRVGGGELRGRVRAGEDLGERFARAVETAERLAQLRYD